MTFPSFVLKIFLSVMPGWAFTLFTLTHSFQHTYSWKGTHIHTERPGLLRGTSSSLVNDFVYQYWRQRRLDDKKHCVVKNKFFIDNQVKKPKKENELPEWLQTLATYLFIFLFLYSYVIRKYHCLLCSLYMHVWRETFRIKR